MKRGSFLLSLMLSLLAGCDIASEWDAASVAEIQAVAVGSNCVTKILSDANREGVTILRRDLGKVKDRCVSVDAQAKAFSN
jgi:chemotaxis receptor (MCP) glutamine deamidase CheD